MRSILHPLLLAVASSVLWCAGCASPVEPSPTEHVGASKEALEPVVAPYDPTPPDLPFGVCNYGAGETLIVGPVVSGPTPFGCSTVEYGGNPYYNRYIYYYKKVQWLGCASRDGSLASWNQYT